MAALLLVLALATALLVAHSAMSGHDMGDAVVMCLAVADTAAGVAAAAAATGHGQRWRVAHRLVAARLAEPRPPAAPVPIAARAGPALGQVFLL